MITIEEANRKALKEALKLDFDNVELYSSENDKYVFSAIFERDVNDIPDVGLPVYIEVTSGSIKIQRGFKG